MARLVVLFPVFNGDKWLHESIMALTGQSYTDYTVIAIDDCSIDNSWDILCQAAKKDPSRWRVFRNAVNLGMTRNWNECIRRQREIFPDVEYIIKIDSDDIPSQGLLKRGVESLDTHTQASLYTVRQMKIVEGVWCPVKAGLIDILAQEGWSNDKNHIMPQRELLYYLIRFDNFMSSSGTMFRAAQFQSLQLPFYNTRYRWAPDYDLWTRLALKGFLAYVADEYIAYRVSAASITAKTRSSVRSAEAWTIGVSSYIRSFSRLGIGKAISLLPIAVYKILLLCFQYFRSAKTYGG